MGTTMRNLMGTAMRCPSAARSVPKNIQGFLARNNEIEAATHHATVSYWGFVARGWGVWHTWIGSEQATKVEKRPGSQGLKRGKVEAAWYEKDHQRMTQKAG
jgi:hypothetical protein